MTNRGWYRRAARAVRSSNQQELALEPFTLTQAPEVPLERSLQCPPPTRLSADQARCAHCGIAWDVDEEHPPCDGPDHHP